MKNVFWSFRSNNHPCCTEVVIFLLRCDWKHIDWNDKNLTSSAACNSSCSISTLLCIGDFSIIHQLVVVQARRGSLQRPGPASMGWQQQLHALALVSSV
jgi:hypothetical protein